MSIIDKKETDFTVSPRQEGLELKMGINPCLIQSLAIICYKCRK